jgi:predicted dehydrogenase
VLAGALLALAARALAIVASGELGEIRHVEARLCAPWMPQLFHRLRVETERGSRSERCPGPATYTAQLAAFARVVRGGAPAPTDLDDAIANMALIDAAYRAAGLAPRLPTPA